MGESPDLIAARQVAKHIGTEHHEITFDEKDVYRVLDKVLYHLETADITTVRASVGEILMSNIISFETYILVRSCFLYFLLHKLLPEIV